MSGAPGEWHIWHWYWHGAGSDFLAAAAGGAHSCAIRVGGTLVCWGDDSEGQLDGIPAGTFAAVSAGGAHTCAIAVEGGSLECWGDDSKGQLDGIPAGTFTAVSAGGAHSCAAPATGRLVCWGDNSYGQSQPQIVSPDPSEATVGEPYSHQFETTAQNPGPEFSVVSGQLPDGLALAADGLLSGEPSTAGSYTFTVAASNGITADAEQEVTLQVIEAPQPSRSRRPRPRFSRGPRGRHRRSPGRASTSTRSAGSSKRNARATGTSRRSRSRCRSRSAAPSTPATAPSI